MYWNWRLPKDMGIEAIKWLMIYKDKDAPYSALDFRFWYYLRKVNPDLSNNPSKQTKLLNKKFNKK
jgi:hypothetical protein